MSATIDKKEQYLDKLVTDILTFTELSAPDESEKFMRTECPDELRIGLRAIKKKNVFPLSYIGAVEPLDLDAVELSRCEEFGIFMDAVPRDVDGKWDISTISTPHEEWKKEGGLFQLTRNRRVSPKEMRGHKIYSEYINEMAVAVLKNDGTYTSVRAKAFYLGKDSRGRGRWAGEDWQTVLIKRDHENGTVAKHMRKLEEDPETCNMVNASLGLQFNRDYEWTTTISLANIGNPVLLATDPIGVRELFCNRESTLGRRAALKHWVEHHWRANRRDPETEIFVRQHLRGIEPFIWKGLNCRLAVSPYDLRLAERLRLEREGMKREGKTVRLRQDQPTVDGSMPALSS